MKRFVVAVTLLLLCIVPSSSLAARHKVPRYLTKESIVGMSNTKPARLPHSGY